MRSTPKQNAPVEAETMMSGDLLIDYIYEAAVVPERWRDVLKALVRIADAKDAVLIAARGTSFTRWMTSSPEFDRIVKLHAQRYAGNLRTSRLVGKQYAGFVHDREVMSQEEIDREPVYRELLIPEGYGSGVATAISSPSGDNIIVHAEYGHTRGPQRAGLMAELDQLRPHLARAALLASRLGLERARAMTEALKSVALPGAVLRGSGRLFVANADFEALMPMIFQDRQERVTIADGDADRRFAAALAGCLTAASRPGPVQFPLRLRMVGFRKSCTCCRSAARRTIFLRRPRPC